MPLHRAAIGITLAASACVAAPKTVRPPARPPTAEVLAQLWVEPEDIAARDLFHGPGGPRLLPDPGRRFEFVSRKATGFSPGWDVKDPAGVEWSVKAGPEAQVEVTVSRLVWAIGFHQPPTYYVRDWSLTGSPEEGPQYNARFRPDLQAMKKTGTWAWHHNPFVGTAPYRGLLVLMLVVNNWDLLERNNVVYDLEEPREGARRWHVTRDLGASLGTARRFPQGSRNDVEGFEREGFVAGVAGGRVRFAYRGRHQELFRDLTPADVRWTCGRLARLTPRQWEDAFRAGGFEPERAARFIRAIRKRVDQGQKLSG
ncbi:MAG TPA: hypothetical protein VII13_19995 [Vicinamibacteria bacterium]|jgi:hypothetical protein